MLFMRTLQHCSIFDPLIHNESNYFSHIQEQSSSEDDDDDDDDDDELSTEDNSGRNDQKLTWDDIDNPPEEPRDDLLDLKKVLRL